MTPAESGDPSPPEPSCCPADRSPFPNDGNAGEGAADHPPPPAKVCGEAAKGGANGSRRADNSAAGEARGVLVAGPALTAAAENWKWAGRGRWAGLEPEGGQGRWWCSECGSRWCSECGSRLNSCGVEELEVLFLTKGLQE